jgi:hypothetical protein
MYINDLPFVSSIFNCVLFADDTTFSVSNSNFSELITTSNIDLCKVEQWTVANKLSLNIGKTFAIVFSNRQFNLDDNNIMFGGDLVRVEREGKFVGFQLDNKLKFDSHIHSVCSKLSKSIWIIYRLKNNVPHEILANLYYTFIYPYLLYCNLVWGGTFPGHLQPLFLLQKKIIRIVTNSDYLAHTDPLFRQTSILKLEDIHKFLLGQYMHGRLLADDVTFRRAHDHATRGIGRSFTCFSETFNHSAYNEIIQNWNT